MANLFRTVTVAVVLALGLPSMAWAAVEEDDEELDAVHHVADGNYLDFSPFGRLELPRILIVRSADGEIGINVFAGTRAAVASARYRLVPAADGAVEEGEVASAVTESGRESADRGEPQDAAAGVRSDSGSSQGHEEGLLVPVSGALIADLSITRHLVFAWIGALLVVLIFVSLAKRYRRGIGSESAPKGLFQNTFEALFMFVRDEIARPNLGSKTDRFLPYILTAFFFILTCNLLGLVPFGSTATANISITGVLAAFTFVITQVSANRDHWKHLFGPPGIPLLVRVILFPVEVLGLFTKPIALAIRLFANMTAGHLVILSLIGLIFTFTQVFGPWGGGFISIVSVLFSLGIYLLELLVAFIQAYIFAMLSALFIGMAVEEHDHHHDEQPDTQSPPVSSSTTLAAGGGLTDRVEAEPVMAS